MAVKRTTSTETAARFRELRSGIRRAAAPGARRRHLDIADYTLDELIACVRERIVRLEKHDHEVPHITKIALKMLLEAKR